MFFYILLFFRFLWRHTNHSTCFHVWSCTPQGKKSKIAKNKRWGSYLIELPGLENLNWYFWHFGNQGEVCGTLAKWKLAQNFYMLSKNLFSLMSSTKYQYNCIILPSTSKVYLVQKTLKYFRLTSPFKRFRSVEQWRTNKAFRRSTLWLTGLTSKLQLLITHDPFWLVQVWSLVCFACHWFDDR